MNSIPTWQISKFLKRAVTVALVYAVAALLGQFWHGLWQRRLVWNIVNNERVINQAPRQTGKGWVLALCCATALLCGLIVTIAMPTLTQSQRILFRAITGNMAKLERVFGSKLRRIRNTETEVLWSNGAELRALSSNEASQKEGYTSHWVVIDEAHNAQPSLLAMFNPYLTQARREGIAKIILNGIGGHPSSVIEAMKDNGYSSLRIDDEIVQADNPSYAPIFEEARQTLSETEYRQHYKCLSVLEGSRYIFPIVNDAIELQRDIAPVRFHFGIDVGRVSDLTVVSVVERCGDSMNLVNELHIGACPFPEQAARVYQFIDGYPYLPEQIGLETNGMGIGLYDDLVKKIFGVRPIRMTYELKRSAIFELQRLMKLRKFGVAEPRARGAFRDLTYEVNETYKYAFAHSDSLSALIIALCTMQTVAGVRV